MKRIGILWPLFVLPQFLSAQRAFPIDSVIAANKITFAKDFRGPGWELLIQNAKRTNYVLIGEDHFINEVPVFTQALSEAVRFDNYVCEMDPWMLRVFKDKLTTLSTEKQNEWIALNRDGFSFFQKNSELDLLRSLIKRNIVLLGTEQVALMSTTILLNQLSEMGRGRNRELYKRMRDSSAVVNSRFFKDMSKPFFLMTPFFRESVERLDRSIMNPEELGLIEDFVISAKIYETGSHRNRIRLMQGNLLGCYASMKGKRNLFKFGANHSIKGESYLPVYDIGTTAHIWAQAENQESFHVLVLPKGGNQAGFLSGSNPIELETEPYRSLKPFFEMASNTEWTYFNLETIREIIRKSQYDLNDPYLKKSISGYDALVVIPMATPAEVVR